jgi:hypothetical protein
VTSAELLNFFSTGLMALVDSAVSNPVALLSLLVAVFVWRQSKADAKLAKETAEFTRRTTEEAAQFDRKTAEETAQSAKEAAQSAKETAVMSVKPHLSLSNDRSPDKGIYNAFIKNNGIGPALIKSFIIYIDGQEATANEHIRPIENAVLQLELAIKEHFTVSIVEGAGVSAGEVEKIFGIELHRENLPLTRNVLDQLNRLDLRIEYTDLYGNLMPIYDSREVEEGF